MSIIKLKNVLLSIFTVLTLTQCKSKTESTNAITIKNTNNPVEAVVPFKEYYPSGNLKIEGQHSNQKKTGQWIAYYEDGTTQYIRNYKNDLPHGHQKIDYSQVLCMEGTSNNGIEVGTWKYYFKNTKAPKYIRHYDENGKQVGTWKSYYDTGELINIENFENNKAHGEQIEYFKNGNISKIGNKIEGKKQGVWKYYFDDGTLRCERTFKDNADHGKYVEYFKNGKIYKLGAKMNFKKTGVWKTFNEQGGLVNTVSYED